MTDVLLIEDEEEIARAFRAILKAFGYSVTLAYTRAEGLEKLIELPSAVILDLMLPDGPGEALIPQIRALLPPPTCKIIVWTALPNGTRLDKVAAMTPDALIFKPLPGGIQTLLDLLPQPKSRTASSTAVDVPHSSDDLVQAVEVNTAAVRANTEAIVEASHRIDGQVG